jgi:hypothetical protein
MASSFGRKKKDRLTDLLIEGLRREWPELAFDLLPDDAIEVRRVADGDQVLIMSLALLRSRGAQGDPEPEKSVLNDPQVRYAMDMAAGRRTLPTIDAGGLVPRLCPSARFSSLEEKPAHREAWSGVWITVCWHDDSAGARYLHLDDLSALELTWDSALSRAVANLEQLWRGKLQMSAVPAPEGGPALIVIDDVHAASALLLPGLREMLARQLGSPFLAMTPQTDEFIAAPLQPRDRADGYFRTARDSFHKSAHPVSDQVLLVRPEGFAVESA